ncbi:endopeptidase La [Thiomicrospira sp. ALE5]|uniref:endopeptidase La n=1 Tax=Thiomicrospira sp. ALE5 TaxID=748650 RepID=UPI0008E6F396|nr:endopeptidase La [Thiomicrospira sp. ALE5]SFR50762.1 ATP-dependent Lon protease [Thiomicrospira sp. ALE5]
MGQLASKDTKRVLIMPLRDVVVFPGSVMPLFVGREKSINAVYEALKRDRLLFLIAQKNPDQDQPSRNDLYEVGTLATILQTLKLPDGTVKVLVEGVQRYSLEQLHNEGEFLAADIEALPVDLGPDTETNPLRAVLVERFFHLAEIKKKLPAEVRESIEKAKDAAKLVDLIAVSLSLSIEKKQQLLGQISINARLEALLSFIEEEIDIIESEKRINMRVKKQIDRTQREYYLNEKLKAIHKELNQDDEDPQTGMEAKIAAAKMPEAVAKRARTEFKKLRQMQAQSAEANVIRNYLDWLVSLPWSKRSRVFKDLVKSQDILDAQHFGLERVKERIIEYLAVQQRVKKLKGPILCLVGPPGVGKTTLARSIAEATNRDYVRVALGGVRDEAEIRGHRRTYIGALPGKIIQKMASVKTKNPLFLLDEVDKMSRDMRGDPASALLEVLDPEQNSHFNDHYLEVDYDLSDVLFVATSNSMDIPEALMDRMEVINLAGYTELEKVRIAIDHLIPRQLKDHGLKSTELTISEEAVVAIIQTYTREAGVRSLDRAIAKICRKAVKAILTEKCSQIAIEKANLADYLGVAKYRFGLASEQDRIGQVTGLAWTRVGGDLLRIEATAMTGKGKLETTGQLGSVMTESVRAAMSVIRSRYKDYGLAANFYETQDLHLHFPEGAIKKDGPSAGIAVCTAIISALTQIPVRADIAMTGEITLRGEVLPIGGLKEKLLAALRGGIKRVLIPIDNVRDLDEIPAEITDALSIKSVQWIEEVVSESLAYAPTPVDDTIVAAEAVVASETTDAAVKTSHH